MDFEKLVSKIGIQVGILYVREIRCGRVEQVFACFGVDLMIVSWIPRLGIVYLLALTVMVWSLFRTFSRKFEKRRRELECYLKIKKPIANFFKLQRNKWRDRKTHVYFKCKKCKAVLRVPKGKGSIVVICTRCKDRIEKET